MQSTPSGWFKRLAFSTLTGFSLVETTVSIGLSALSLSLLLGLLPMGMNLSHHATRQAEASRLLKQLATGIQAAARQDDGSYHLLGTKPFDEVRWSAGDAALPSISGIMTSSGMPAANQAEGDFAYVLEITPPAHEWDSGRAMLRIAWPATATWDGDKWSRSTGFVRSLVLFRPE